MLQLNTELLFTWLSRFLVMVACMPIHEWAHAFAADRMGDPTPRLAGRLTLNPFAHLSLFGSVMLITVGFGWAKPVPINASRFRRPKLGMAVTAAAGPLSNIVMAALVMACFKVVMYIQVANGSFTSYPVLYNVVGGIISVNLGLAIFNLLPIPPLDGSRLFGAFLPDHIYFGVMRYEQYIMIGLMAVLYLGWLDLPLSLLRDLLEFFILFLTSPVDYLMEAILFG